ncbi:MAG TPA: VWA domain-containing protein [Candidatus Acidoferrum sp.]|nr:VWA domain-containing protein [Candidatus Acidoferrum sp.]
MRISLCGQTPAPPAPAQNAGAKSDSTAKPAPAAAEDNQEVSSRDTPTTFKVRVNLVLVRVVVRDEQGKVVPNLKKEDFQLLDNRKLQNVSSFSVETPESRMARSVASPDPAADRSPAGDFSVGKSMDLPQRFVSLVFDDVHLSMQDAVFVRDSASRFLSSLAPSDRAGFYTTSGQLTQEFTQDHEALKKALLGILPRGMADGSFHDCPEVGYYQADLIVNKNDAQALAVATEDAVQCAFQGDETMRSAAQALAQSGAQRALSTGDNDTQYAYRHLEQVVRRLSGMPGQRVLVLISPGFIQSTLQMDASDLVDRATRSNIVINTIDARGLYVPDLGGDIASPSRDSFRTAGFKTTYRVEAQSAQEEVLAQFADGTGGTFYHNRNDLDEAMREAGAAPEISYLLGFSPQNLKIDGRYHTLKVALTNKRKYNIQARHGYFAPRSVADPEEATKQEMQEALFSQEEIHDLPIELQTQFFKKEDAGARLAVLTHFDLKGLRFRKAQGRNNDKLTIVTGIFDENGNLVTGGEKIVEMKLLDTTYDRLSRSGFTVKSSFDVKPGSYLVRLVVRDAEGSQMAARNGAVVIPN